MHLLFPLLVSFIVVGMAEMGDRTQILTITLASRFPMDKVLYGIFSATAAIMLIAVFLGVFVQKFIPSIFITILAGAFFIIYGLTMLMPNAEEREKEEKIRKAKGQFWTIFGSFFFAEIGDKTQLAAMALTAKFGSPAMVWLGATLGMMTANVFGIVIANILRNYLPERILIKASGLIFIIFGVITFLGVIFRA